MPVKRLMNSEDSSLNTDEQELEYSLRPQKFTQVIGREREKATLEMMISAANKKQEAIDHILFHGPPGLGKTSLAYVLANEMGVNLQITSGPALEKQGDLAAILTALEPRSILFIDEIHRLNRNIEEILYPAMEDKRLDIIVGKGPGARTHQITLEPFTIVAATTRVGLITKPLLDRFGVDFRLDFYNSNEMKELVKQKANFLSIEIEPNAAALIAERARSTPRIAVKILKRVRDNAISKDLDLITDEIVMQTLELLEVDDAGLDYLDKKIIQTIINNFDGGPVGLKSLAASLSEELDTISDVYEPYLLQKGFLKRTARGRIATKKAYTHFGYDDYNE